MLLETWNAHLQEISNCDRWLLQRQSRDATGFWNAVGMSHSGGRGDEAETAVVDSFIIS